MREGSHALAMDAEKCMLENTSKPTIHEFKISVTALTCSWPPRDQQMAESDGCPIHLGITERRFC